MKSKSNIQDGESQHWRNVRLTATTNRAVVAISESDGHNNQSQTVREAIEAYIDQRSAADGIDYAATARAPRAAAVQTGA